MYQFRICSMHNSLHLSDGCANVSSFSTDVNECMTDNGGCSHKCINTYQSHKCRCPNGLVLSSNGKTCVTGKLPNSCTDGTGILYRIVVP